MGSKNYFRFISSFIIISLYAGSFSFALFYGYNKILEAPLDSGGYLMVVLYIAALLGVCEIMGALKVGLNRRFNIIVSHIISILLVNFFAYLQLSLIHRAFLPVKFIIFLSFFQILISVVWTYLVFKLNKIFNPAKDLILVFGDKKAEDFAYKLIEREDGYHVVESVEYKENLPFSGDNLNEVFERIKKYKAAIIYRLPSAVRNDILKFCYENDIEVLLPPRISDVIIRGAKEINQFDSPLIVCRNCALSVSQRALKRFFDVVISVLGIVITSPIMAIIALAIKIEDRGPVIFKQRRVTLNERVFYIYKFRSMTPDAEKNDGVIPARNNDPRITKVGKVIRTLRLDELPQLFNILKGDMSLVGPRPERVEHHETYSRLIPEFPYRNKVKAGLTGYAQVMGKYNTSPYDKLLLDLEYIQNFSFFLDLKIILLTAKIVFMKESTEGFNSDLKDG